MYTLPRSFSASMASVTEHSCPMSMSAFVGWPPRRRRFFSRGYKNTKQAAETARNSTV